MPIHDQSYRRYGGGKAPPGRSWTVIAWAGILTIRQEARSFLGDPALRAGCRSSSAPCRFYVATTLSAGRRFSAPTAETFRSFLEQQDFFVFVITIYVGAGLIANDRRANALQIYLSKPLMRTEYIAGKLAVLFAFLLLVTLVPALLLLVAADRVRGQLRVPADQPVPHSRRSPWRRSLQVLLASFTMLALSSLSKSTRFVGIMYAGIIFFTKAIFGVLYAITGTTRVSWISLGDEPGAGGRRDLPAEAALRDAVAGLAARDRRPGRRVDLGPRAARARRGGGDVSAAAATVPSTRRARLEVVRPGHRPQRRHRRGAARRHRPARARTAPASPRS